MDDVSLPAISMSPTGKAINKLALSEMDDINIKAEAPDTNRGLLDKSKNIQRLTSMKEQRPKAF